MMDCYSVLTSLKPFNGQFKINCPAIMKKLIVCLATSVDLAFEPKMPICHTLKNAVSNNSAIKKTLLILVKI